MWEGVSWIFSCFCTILCKGTSALPLDHAKLFHLHIVWFFFTITPLRLIFINQTTTRKSEPLAHFHIIGDNEGTSAATNKPCWCFPHPQTYHTNKKTHKQNTQTNKHTNKQTHKQTQCNPGNNLWSSGPCNIISVQYKLDFHVDPSGLSFDLVVSLPITVHITFYRILSHVKHIHTGGHYSPHRVHSHLGSPSLQSSPPFSPQSIPFPQ